VTTGLLERIIGRPLAVAGNALDERWWSTGVGGMSAAGVLVDDQQALKISAVYECLRIWGDVIGSLPLPLYRRRPGGGKERASDLALYRILHDQPNLWQTSIEWRSLMMNHVLMRGNAYSEQIQNDRGDAEQLIPLHPDRVTPTLQPNGRILYKVRKNDLTTREVPQERIFHLRSAISRDGIKGVGVLEVAQDSFGTARATDRHAGRFFSQDSTPPGVLTCPGELSKEARTNLREEWQQLHSGANAQQIAVLQQGMTFTPIAMSHEQSQFLESRHFQVADVARWFGIPLMMLQETDKATSWGCLPGDTLIFTTEGPRPIEDIAVGSSVWSLSEGGMVPARVTAHRMTGVRKHLIIETVGRTIRPTDNHRMLVRRYQGRHDGRRNGRTAWETLWLSAGEVRVGDYLPVPHRLSGLHGDQAPNGRKVTVGAMEFCGLFTGDGNLDGTGRVEIAHEAEPDHMARYRHVIRQEFDAEPRTDARKTRTRFSSKAARELLDCGFTGTALTKRVAPWVFGLRPELQLAYLRGYLDADGSVQRGRIVFSSANKMLLEDVRHLCIQTGVPVGRVCVGRKAGTGTIRGQSFNAGPKYQLSLSSLPFNSKIGSNSPHKASRFVAQPTTRTLRYDEGWDGGRGPVRDERRPSHGWPYQDIRLHKIQRITESDIAVPVYDITVEGTETFVADGVLVHNTGIEQFQIAFVIHAVRPWCVRWEQAISRDVIIDTTNLFAEFLLDGLLRGDAKSRNEALQIMRQNGIINADEWRELENMNPQAGKTGQDYWRPANMVPADTPVGAIGRFAGASAQLQLVAKQAAGRLVRKECAALIKAAQKHAADEGAWLAWAEKDFYPKHGEEIVRDLHVRQAEALAYCGQHVALLRDNGARAIETFELDWIDQLAQLALGGA